MSKYVVSFPQTGELKASDDLSGIRTCVKLYYQLEGVLDVKCLTNNLVIELVNGRIYLLEVKK